MILESVKHGPLIWPTIEENGVTRTNKYVELSATEKIQADCDMKETNIILKGDDPIACLNKAMAFLTVVASLRFLLSNNQLRTSSNLRNQATIQDGRVTVQQVQGRQGQSYSSTGHKVMLLVMWETMQPDRQGLINATTVKQLVFLADPGVLDGQAVQSIIPNNASFQTEDLDTYDSDCDNISNAKAVLMANISNYGSDVISEFDYVVKKRTTTDARTEDEWGFKHTKAVFNNEIIPFLKSLKDIFNVFDRDLLNEIIRAKSAKKHKKQNIWKPTGHVFTEVGLKWKPTIGTFTTVGNSCPLTRITSANVVPLKKTTSDSIETQKPELKVYNRKPKNVRNVGSSKKAKIIESMNANHSEPNHTCGSNATNIPSSSSLVMTVRFRNGYIARIMGYGDYQLGNVTILRVYYVKGLGHNLFFVGQFCNADLEVTFQKNTCFIRNLEGVDLLSGSHDTNLYTISLDDMLKTSLICLLSKASQTKSWLWHLLVDAVPRAVVLADSSVSTSIDQDAPSTSIPSSLEQQNSLIISQGSRESPKTLLFCDDPLHDSLHEDSTSQGSSLNVRKTHTSFEYLGAVDPTLFTRQAENDLLLVQLYVDDIIFSSTNTAMCNEFANQMTTKFKMSMMG
nr:integrase, catalytic region, zinc finger, CCHC-type, peptidase aspartic, catalytic [Tanacetum cinerariifolium]